MKSRQPSTGTATGNPRRPAGLAVLAACAALWAPRVQAQSAVTDEPLVRAYIDESGELVVTPSASSSSSDFDFFVGRWNVRNRRLICGLAGCTEWQEYAGTDHVRSILNGIGLTNDNRSIVEGERLDGLGLTLFDPETRLWSIYWADSRTGVLDDDRPVVGSFDGDIGTF